MHGNVGLEHGTGFSSGMWDWNMHETGFSTGMWDWNMGLEHELDFLWECGTGTWDWIFPLELGNMGLD